MFRNYIKIAWRNIIKQRFYSLLNIIGLSTGIAFTMLIMAYVWKELQVNARLRHADRQYIILSKWKDPNMGYELATFGGLPKALKEGYPSLVTNYYRFDGITSTVSKDEKHFREGLQLGDSTLLKMYGFKVLHGDVNTALNNPDAVVITAGKAMKYFGSTDVTGQTLTVESFSGTKQAFTVSAVMEQPAPNSITNLSQHSDNEFFFPLSAASFFGRQIDNWNNTYIVGFVELAAGVSPAALNKPMQQLIKQNIPPDVAANFTPQLVSLRDYYLEANNGLVKRMLFILSAIALFILLMAVINFINMSISRSASRMKEIGIRKVLGGLRKQLVGQFLAESVILVSVATGIAMMLYLCARPLLAGILGKTVPGITELPPYFIACPFILILITGLAAGLYPAFVLSSLGSIDSLKGKLTTVKENVLLRRSLLVFQFITAAIVLIGAFVISKQVHLFFSRDLGYNKDYVVSAQVPRDWTPTGVARMEGIRRQFAALPQVQQATLSYEVPDGNNAGSFALYRAGADSTTAVTTYNLYADEYYASAYGIPMAAGEFFNREGAFRDSSRLVINETQARAMGWKYPQDAVGSQVKIVNVQMLFTIAGVTKDFHFGSMQQAVQPITFMHTRLSNTFRYLSFKLKPGNMSAAVNALQKEWNTLMPGAAFEYRFMDETLERLYQSELQLKQASYTATALSLIIVLLGVMGMISLSIQKRTKEIGIRKVLGSSISGIVALFLKEFLSVIVIAGMIACPLGYLIMQQWLNDYVYRINLSAQPFLVTMLLLALVTTVLIILQTMRTALANPMKSLRTE
ncbi:FtsX-like permease family protein [Chitinophaga agrisoli]|uniref:FtsX-like permease family protein n=1 Tax=Chitinophaga agrisoli TaxID=2607653 RepID=A0A5B2VMQ4_9BACT|nr:ABC transporter permease [Chitinophaga agrisoli]KAA2239429.1 FtsX-like permease family protein [Chitinophaga agrisoli]